MSEISWEGYKKQEQHVYSLGLWTATSKNQAQISLRNEAQQSCCRQGEGITVERPDLKCVGRF